MLSNSDALRSHFVFSIQEKGTMGSYRGLEENRGQRDTMNLEVYAVKCISTYACDTSITNLCKKQKKI
jgi:hypothetical protein